MYETIPYQSSCCPWTPSLRRTASTTAVFKMNARRASERQQRKPRKKFQLIQINPENSSWLPFAISTKHRHTSCNYSLYRTSLIAEKAHETGNNRRETVVLYPGSCSMYPQPIGRKMIVTCVECKKNQPKGCARTARGTIAKHVTNFGDGQQEDYGR